MAYSKMLGSTSGLNNQELHIWDWGFISIHISIKSLYICNIHIDIAVECFSSDCCILCFKSSLCFTSFTQEDKRKLENDVSQWITIKFGYLKWHSYSRKSNALMASSLWNSFEIWRVYVTPHTIMCHVQCSETRRNISCFSVFINLVFFLHNSLNKILQGKIICQDVFPFPF